MEPSTGRATANGVTFHYLEMGRGPLVLCLHGFPDNAHTYSDLLPVLAAAGFRGVAPFMRGYAPTTPAPDGRYQSVLLAQDAVALIARAGGRARLFGRSRLGGRGHVWRGRARPRAHRAHRHHRRGPSRGLPRRPHHELRAPQGHLARLLLSDAERRAGRGRQRLCLPRGLVARRLAGIRSRARHRAREGDVPSARRGDGGAQLLSPHVPSGESRSGTAELAGAHQHRPPRRSRRSPCTAPEIGPDGSRPSRAWTISSRRASRRSCSRARATSFTWNARARSIGESWRSSRRQAGRAGGEPESPRSMSE